MSNIRNERLYQVLMSVRDKIPLSMQEIHAWCARKTLRDWFAGHAPDVPQWFPYEDVGRPQGVTTESIKEFESAMDKALERRYFAWRWYYADAMLRARDSFPPAASRTAKED